MTLFKFGYTPAGIDANTNLDALWARARLMVNATDFAGVDPTGASDSTAGLQNAINAASGATLYVPPGTYLVTATLTRNTVGNFQPALRIQGAGMMRTIFKNAIANGPLFSASGDAAGGFQYGLSFADFSIIASGAPAGSRGIDIRGVWLGTIAGVSISGLTGDAVRLTCTVGDPDSSSNIGISRCNLVSNGGWGVNCVSGLGIIAISFLAIEDSLIDLNTAGGINLCALVSTIRRNSISQNGNTGIAVTYHGIGIRLCRILENEFDTNALSHINIGVLLNGLIADNWFKSFTGITPPVGVIIGDGSHPVESLVVARNMVTLTPPGSVHTCYSVSAGALQTRFEDNNFPGISAPAIRYLDAGTGTFIRDDIGGTKEREAVQTFTLGGGATATPNLTVAGNLRLICNGATATLAAPSGVAPDVGVKIEVDIVNNSGGGLTVTMDPIYHVAGYTDPAAGKRRTAMFRWDPVSAYYVQIGAWSPDI